MKKKLLIGLIIVVVGVAIYGGLYYSNMRKEQERLKDIEDNKTTEWSNVYEVPGSYTSYVDLKSIHIEGKYVSVIVLIDYIKVHHDLNDFSAKKNLLFNCETNNNFLQAWDKRYSGHMGSGEMIHHTIVEDIELKEPQVIYPHDRKILEVACLQSKNKPDETNKQPELINKEVDDLNKQLEYLKDSA
jgi:hypothetical protein